MKKLNSVQIGAIDNVAGGTITPSVPVGTRVREIWAYIHGNAASGVTPSFNAMGALTIKQTGPGNAGELAQADTLDLLVAQMNRRGGIFDATYAASSDCYCALCLYYAYEDGDDVNCLYFQDGQGLAIKLGDTASGAAVWDTLDVQIMIETADDEECWQLYVPHTSQRQITLGGGNPVDMEGNLLEFYSTAGSSSNPTDVDMRTGTNVEIEGTWEGQRRKGNAKWPIEATQTTLLAVLHGLFTGPQDIFQMVRSGTQLRYSGGTGSTQLFQRFVTFQERSSAASVVKVQEIAATKRAKLRDGSELPDGIKAIAIGILSDPKATRASLASSAIIRRTSAI